MRNFKDDFLDACNSDKGLSKNKLVSLAKVVITTPNKNPTTSGSFITYKTAGKYIKQWTTFKNELDSFLKLSRVPANYNDFKSPIHALRENLLKYELIDLETFRDNNFIEKLSALLNIPLCNLRIFMGIKTIQDIADEFYKGNLVDASKDDVVMYLNQNYKSMISCVVIMITNP